MLNERIVRNLSLTQPVWVIKAFLNGDLLPSAGPEEDAVNAAILDSCRELADGIDQITDLQQLLELIAEAEAMEPLTQKQNLQNASEAYHQASGALAELRFALARQIDQNHRAIEPVLVDRIRYRAWSSRTDPQDTVSYSGDGFSLDLQRSERRDKWHLTLEFDDAGNRRQSTNPIWVRTGHLSGQILELKCRLQDAADPGVQVLSVVVNYRDGVKSSRHRDILALATECRLTDIGGEKVPAWSAWREQTYEGDALLPHIGPKVRLGDLLLEAGKPFCLRSELTTVNTWEVPFTLPITPRGWTVARDKLCEIYYLVPPEGDPPGAIELFHPDHYKVRVTELTPDRVIRVKQICGRTQYRPPEDNQGD